MKKAARTSVGAAFTIHAKRGKLERVPQVVAKGTRNNGRGHGSLDRGSDRRQCRRCVNADFLSARRRQAGRHFLGRRAQLFARLGRDNDAVAGAVAGVVAAIAMEQAAQPVEEARTVTGRVGNALAHQFEAAALAANGLAPGFAPGRGTRNDLGRGARVAAVALKQAAQSFTQSLAEARTAMVARTDGRGRRAMARLAGQ